jgi:prepilin-type N-terminal cleavage/methylation domain-containing protein/prepilin-type processing-associated H-X9-DG protein
MSNARASRHRGFTLIELLVVIAIIAILAAILFPVFAQVREKARAAACLSNMKQMSIGVMLYTQDYDEQLFYRAGFKNSRSGSIPNSDPVRWWNLLMPYLRSGDVFRCPSDPNPTPSADANSQLTIKRSFMALVSAESLSLAQVDNPSETIVIAEKWPEKTDSWIEPYLGNLGWDPANPGRTYVTANRHQGSMNCAFFDGHAKLMRPDVILRSKDLSGCGLIYRYPFPDFPGSTAPSVFSPSNNPSTPNMCTPSAANGFTYP